MKQNPMYADMLRVFSNTELEGGTMFSKLVVVGTGAYNVYNMKSIVDNSIGVGKAINHAGSHGFSSIVNKSGFKLATGATKTIASKQAITVSSNPIVKVIHTIKKGLDALFKGLKDIEAGIKQKIYELLPEVAYKVLGDIVSNAMNIYTALDKAKGTIEKTVHYLKSNCISATHASNKVGSYVITSIREQLKSVALKNATIALQSGGTILVNTMSAGIGASVTTIANAIVSIFKFLVGLINKWRMEKNFLDFKRKCSTYLVNIDSMSNERLESFFAEHIRKVPIVAAYIMCIPHYGSPYNFLQILNVTPPNAMTRYSPSRGFRKLKSKITGRPFDSDKVAHQKNIIAAFETLKEDAREFIDDCPIKLESKKPAVLEVLKAARGQMNFLPGSGLDVSMVAHAYHNGKFGKAHHVTARLDMLVRSDVWK